MAQEREYNCESLIAEYENLRQRTEGLRMLGDAPTVDDIASLNIRKNDLDRLIELESLIDRDCEMYVSAERDIDIPRDPGLMGSSYESRGGD